jgi:hypothetical protein
VIGIVRRLEIAAHRGTDAQRAKVTGADADAIEALGLGPTADGGLPTVGNREGVERTIPLGNFAIGVKRHVGARPVGNIPDHHDPIRLRVRQRRKQNGIHRAENRGIGADAEREREDGDGSEAGRFAQVAKGVTNILHQRFKEVRSARLAAFFFDLVGASEFETRAPPRFRERHASLNEFLSLPLEMKSQLVVEFVLNSLAPKQCT